MHRSITWWSVADDTIVVPMLTWSDVVSHCLLACLDMCRMDGPARMVMWLRESLPRTDDKGMSSGVRRQDSEPRFSLTSVLISVSTSRRTKEVVVACMEAQHQHVCIQHMAPAETAD